MEEKVLAPGIVLYNLDQEKCKDFLKNFVLYSENFLEVGTINRKIKNSYTSIVDEDYRNCKVFGLSQISKCPTEDPFVKCKKEFNSLVLDYIEKFKAKYGINDLISEYDWIFLRYDSGGFFKVHADDSHKYARTVSVSVYLNDEYDGGEILFPYFNIKYKPKSGDILIFSSAFPYAHSVEPITSGTRYALVNWYSFAKTNL
jgi:Rps23 Pro-64 3,4-dihydroxylase Tpa1-like proline 4-hydroxylase